MSGLHATSTLFAIFDCCHPGLMIEFIFVYRSNVKGIVKLSRFVKEGLHLMQAAQHLIQEEHTRVFTPDGKNLSTGGPASGFEAQ